MGGPERQHDRLKPEVARALEEIAGHDLDGGLLGPFQIGVDRWPSGVRGVYVVFDPTGKCAYVGKVCSDLDGRRLEGRMKQHLREPRKLQTFDCYYVVPLRSSASNLLVEKAEGWIARHMRPYLSDSHPNPFRRSRARG